MPPIGRRFTIEPKSQRTASTYPSRPERQLAPKPPKRLSQRPSDASSSAISGIRLLPGNALIVSRKYGSARDQLISDLTNCSPTFTVTERGLEPEAFVRVMYRCPRTVFVQTVRGDEGEVPAKQVSSLHKTYQFDREAGQALIIRPCVSPEEAALDIEANGLFVQHWFDEERGNVCLQVAATAAWEVVRGEQLVPQGSPGLTHAVLNEASEEFLAAFLTASEHYLDREEFDLLKEQAWSLVNGSRQS